MNEHSSQWKPSVDWQGFPAARGLRGSSRANSEGQLLPLPWGVSHSPGKSDASSCSHLCSCVQATLVLNARRKEKEAGVNLFCHDYFSYFPPKQSTPPSPTTERPVHQAVRTAGGMPAMGLEPVPALLRSVGHPPPQVKDPLRTRETAL